MRNFALRTIMFTVIATVALATGACASDSQSSQAVAADIATTQTYQAGNPVGKPVELSSLVGYKNVLTYTFASNLTGLRAMTEPEVFAEFLEKANINPEDIQQDDDGRFIDVSEETFRSVIDADMNSQLDAYAEQLARENPDMITIFAIGEMTASYQ